MRLEVADQHLVDCIANLGWSNLVHWNANVDLRMPSETCEKRSHALSLALLPVKERVITWQEGPRKRHDFCRVLCNSLPNPDGRRRLEAGVADRNNSIRYG